MELTPVVNQPNMALWRPGNSKFGQISATKGSVVVMLHPQQTTGGQIVFSTPEELAAHITLLLSVKNKWEKIRNEDIPAPQEPKEQKD